MKLLSTTHVCCPSWLPQMTCLFSSVDTLLGARSWEKTSAVVIVWLLQGEMTAGKSDRALKVIHGRSFLVATSTPQGIDRSSFYGVGKATTTAIFGNACYTGLMLLLAQCSVLVTASMRCYGAAATPPANRNQFCFSGDRSLPGLSRFLTIPGLIRAHPDEAGLYLARITSIVPVPSLSARW